MNPKLCKATGLQQGGNCSCLVFFVGGAGVWFSGGALEWVAGRGHGVGNKVVDGRGVGVQPRLPICMSCRMLKQ